MSNTEQIFERVVGDVVGLVKRAGATAIDFWRQLPIDDCEAIDATLGAAIRTKYSLWRELPVDVNVNLFSDRIIKAVHAEILNHVATVSEVDDGAEFEPAEMDSLEFGERVPMSAETIEAMRQATWIHQKTGNAYKVVAVTNTHADNQRRAEYPITVVYEDRDGLVWSREIGNFVKAFTRGAKQ